MVVPLKDFIELSLFVFWYYFDDDLFYFMIEVFL